MDIERISLVIGVAVVAYLIGLAEGLWHGRRKYWRLVDPFKEANELPDAPPKKFYYPDASSNPKTKRFRR